MANTHSLSFSLDISPVEFSELMYKNTDSKGNLNMQDWYDVEKDDTTSFKDYSCKIKWGEDPMEMFMDYMNSQRFLKLETAAKHFGYSYNAHNALEDTKAALYCL